MYCSKCVRGEMNLNFGQRTSKLAQLYWYYSAYDNVEKITEMKQRGKKLIYFKFSYFKYQIAQ